jgi:hypothetical protein
MQDKTNELKILVLKHVGWLSDQAFVLFSKGLEFKPLQESLFFVSKKD